MAPAIQLPHLNLDTWNHLLLQHPSPLLHQLFSLECKLLQGLLHKLLNTKWQRRQGRRPALLQQLLLVGEQAL